MEGVFKHVLIFCSMFTFGQVVSGRSREFIKVPLGADAVGPESIAFDCKGQGPYVGISDGRILKWGGQRIGWTQFAVTTPNRTNSCDGVLNSPTELTCGRPLGMMFNKATCELYIADSSFGLMKVSRKGGVATLLASSAEGIPFIFLNGLDIDSCSGIVYFTETSTRYHRWEGLQAINNGDQSGRFMKYDPKTRKVTVLLRDLAFANGVAVSQKNEFVLVAETTKLQVLKYWLTGPKSGTSEVFLSLAGRPDNLHKTVKGEFWVSERGNDPIKVDNSGQFLDSLASSVVGNLSDVTEFRNHLWIGYSDQPYVLYSTA